MSAAAAPGAWWRLGWALRAAWRASWSRSSRNYLLAGGGVTLGLRALIRPPQGGAHTREVALGLLVVPAALVVGLLLRAVRRERQPSLAFLAVAPVGAVERRLALLLVDYVPVLLLAALACLLLPASLRPPAAGLALAFVGLGAASSWAAPLAGWPPFVMLAMTFSLVPPPILVGAGGAAVAFDLARALWRDPEVTVSASWWRWRPRLLDRSLLALLLATEPAARLTSAMVAFGVAGVVVFPGGPYGLPHATACACAGAALAPFLLGAPAEALGSLPLRGRWRLRLVLSWSLAAMAALPAAALLNHARLGQAGRYHLLIAVAEAVAGAAYLGLGFMLGLQLMARRRFEATAIGAACVILALWTDSSLFVARPKPLAPVIAGVLALALGALAVSLVRNRGQE